MKKYLISVLCLIVITLLLVFSSNNAKGQNKVVATSFYPVYIATLNIIDGVEGVTVFNLASETVGCIHDYTLSPQDMVKLSDADCLIINGSKMENFIEDVIQNYPELDIIDISEGVNEIECTKCHESNESRSLHHEHGVNPHTFVSVDNHIIQVNNLARGMSKIDKENSEIYLRNAEEYTNKLENLKANISDQLSPYANVKILALHESFEYFAKEFNLDVIDVIEVEEGQAISAKDVAEIIQKITAYNVKAIALESGYVSYIANSIAKDTATQTFEFDPIVSGNIDKDAYITKMNINLKNILKALEEEKR